MNIKSILSGLAIVAFSSAPVFAQSNADMMQGLQRLMNAFDQVERDAGLPPGTFRNTPTNRPVGVTRSQNVNGRIMTQTCYNGNQCTPWQ